LITIFSDLYFLCIVTCVWLMKEGRAGQNRRNTDIDHVQLISGLLSAGGWLAAQVASS